MDNKVHENNTKTVSMKMALLAMIILGLILIGGFAIFKLGNHVVFLLAITAMSIIGVISGFTLNDIQDFFVEGCENALLVALILMVVGTVVGAWVVSGIVPTIIYYGLKFLTPSSFLVTGFLVTCVVTFFIGSSYSSIATLGVAFMGIGMGLGIKPGLTAGMIVSGAIFGDKMSPFSDTTNLAPAVAGTDLFSHIKSMLWTTGPALVISTIIYAFMGSKQLAGNVDLTIIENINKALTSNFNISPILLIVPVLTIILAVKQVPPLISLLIGALAGIVAAFIFQGNIYDYKTILNALGTGFSAETGMAEVDRLLNRGGIMGMMSTVSLAFLALGLGEILQKMGVLKVVLEKMDSFISTPRSLVLTTLVTCLITTLLTASQYLAILLPGQVMKDAYTRLGVDKRVLSRTLEDGGTIFTFLIPWSTTGIYVSGVLDIGVMEYAPYAYLAILCPLIAIFYAITGIAIFKDESTNVSVE